MYLSRLLFLFFFYPGWLFAQEADTFVTSRTAGFKISASHAVLRDDFVMPLNYMGPGATIGGFWERTTAKTHQNLHFDAHFSMLKDFLGFEALYAYPSLRYAYAWRITGDSNRRINAFAGPMAGAQYNVYYFFQTDDSHVQWLTQYNIGTHAVVDVTIRQNKKLRLTVEFPLLRLCSRPPMDIYNSNFNPAFGKMMRMFNSNAEVLLGAGGWRFGAFYPLRETQKTTLQFGYEHFITNYFNVGMMTNSLTIKYGFRK